MAKQRKSTQQLGNSPEPITTQRAYTLRLRPAIANSDSPEEIQRKTREMQDALWATHEAVNKGAKVFGDWLLTLRGGLCHTLADARIKSSKGKPDREPTSDERRNRRILLALSWLSVESAPKEDDTYKEFVVATGTDSTSDRNEKVKKSLRLILQRRDVNGDETDSWIKDCEASLCAAIRKDAVWVNRSEAFDEAQERIGRTFTRECVWDMLDPFLGGGDAYFAASYSGETDDGDSNRTEEKPKDLVQKAGQWLSSRFGTGKGADFERMALVYDVICAWAVQSDSYASGSVAIASLAESLASFQPISNDADGILSLISGPGYKSATRNIIKKWGAETGTITNELVKALADAAVEDASKCRSNSGEKGRRPYSDVILDDVEHACGFSYLVTNGPARHSEFAVMLDHAARRVSIAHSWIKRAEAERQTLAVDAGKIASVPAEAKEWLDQYCRERSGDTNALDAYRIRKRAVQAWREILAKWGRPTCQSVEARVDAARETQNDPEIDKFGDIQLFEALAEDDAKCVWQIDGRVDSQPLLDYVAATDARAKQSRFKVPAYRHPDPLAHPVFCDFGNSRWDIRFAAHEAAVKLSEAHKKVEKKRVAVAKAREKLENARTAEQLGKTRESLNLAEQDLHDAQAAETWLSQDRAVSMGLWDRRILSTGLALHWSSKRLSKDMALRQSDRQYEQVNVTRADRLGRAAGGAKSEEEVRILGVFDEQHWNGRLQAPRRQLDDIAARIAKHGWDAKARRMRDRIRWLITFSAKLHAQGPWISYCGQFGDNVRSKPFVSKKKGEYAVKHQDNETRHGGHAKLILSRLPGLRVLSVDLGHRFAAACAVWEALDSEQMRQICHQAGHAPPKESDLFLHLARIGPDEKSRTTIYRRIGADKLPDGSIHPAPWAGLDRQFLIKLPGEERPARAASLHEQTLVSAFASRLGVVSDDDDKGRQVDELMSRAIRIATLGLKRHARRAKIAYAFNPNTAAIPGVGGSESRFQTGDEDHVDFLTNTLVDWHALASDANWNDEMARDLWNASIATPENGLRIPTPCDDEASKVELARQQRHKLEEELRERLRPIAAVLASTDRTPLYQAWSSRWCADDGLERNQDDFHHEKSADESGRRRSHTTAKRPTFGWHAELRWLTDWIMGKRLPGETGDGWKRNVGGLSLTRIATMKSLYQLHKAYAMRARPDKPRGAPEKGESNEGIAESILRAMERMREQRVKQIASRIAEGALGIGRIKGELVERGVRRPRESVEAACHAVVIENLTNYRPEETRTRRENRQLMSWSSSKVKKYLSEACQLHGLHLREVSAGYTSRQDSRTGSPGVRCKDVPVLDFMTAAYWRKQVNAARKKIEERGIGTKRDQYLVNLDDMFGKISQEAWKGYRPLRIPMNGGELFVSANSDSPAAKGIQADLNAAANIGLKALLDPDWPGKWWYVPCESATFKPHPEKTKGSGAIDLRVPLVREAEPMGEHPSAETPKKRRGNKPKAEREIVNLWRDPTCYPVSAEGSLWRISQAYWNDVQSRVVQILRKSIDL